jgi:Xylose isomerase-like TIM barrel
MIGEGARKRRRAGEEPGMTPLDTQRNYRLPGPTPAVAPGERSNRPAKVAPMKIGCSSESFARSIDSDDLTQLEWLDLCANELEVDGVVFAAAHFPRTDNEYLAQLKKVCADLGLCIAAISASDAFWNGGEHLLDLAVTLGAPLAIAPAAPAGTGPDAWGTFAAAVKGCTRLAKERNVTLAVRNLPGTLCANGSDLRRLAKDVDSAWLRFALDPAPLETDDAHALLPKSAIAVHAIPDLAGFATTEDGDAPSLITRLARFRGFVILDAPPPAAGQTASHPYHDALERFTKLRAETLTAPPV